MILSHLSISAPNVQQKVIPTRREPTDHRQKVLEKNKSLKHPLRKKKITIFFSKHFEKKNSKNFEKTFFFLNFFKKNFFFSKISKNFFFFKKEVVSLRKTPVCSPLAISTSQSLFVGDFLLDKCVTNGRTN